MPEITVTVIFPGERRIVGTMEEGVFVSYAWSKAGFTPAEAQKWQFSTLKEMRSAGIRVVLGQPLEGW